MFQMANGSAEAEKGKTMRLIDADALGIGRCNPDEFPLDNRAYCAGWNGVIGLIERAPTVDAVPVVHGRWEFEVTKEFGCRYHNFAVKAKCSECGKKRPAWYGAFPHLDDEEAELAALVNAAAQKHPKFCEECGAKMDGGNDG